MSVWCLSVFCLKWMLFPPLQSVSPRPAAGRAAVAAAAPAVPPVLVRICSRVSAAGFGRAVRRDSDL